MKKIQFSIVFLTIVGVTNAQTGQGGWIIGGSTDVSISSSSNSRSNTQAFALSTRTGHFFANNFLAGLDLNFIASSTNRSKTREVTIGPFARYYIGGIFYTGLGYSISGSNQFNESGDLGAILSLELGYPIFVKNNIAVEPRLNYLRGSGNLGYLRELGLDVGVFLYF
jgi:hypothetical protein